MCKKGYLMSTWSAIAVSALSVAMWGVSIIGVDTPAMPERAFLAVLAGAAMTGVMAAMLWVMSWVRRRAGSLGLLVRTIADVTRPDAGLSGRLRRVR
jgi:hypothetical protein